MKKIYAVIICTTDCELEACLRLEDWHFCDFSNKDFVYYKASFFRDEIKHDIVLARTMKMGSISSAVLTMIIYSYFETKFIFLSGILAFTSSNVDENLYGDIIIAKKVFDVSGSKFTSKSDSNFFYKGIGFDFRPESYHVLDKNIEKLITADSHNSKNQYKIKIGNIICTSTVFAINLEQIWKKFKSEYNIVGLEMESAGILKASTIWQAEKKPNIIIVKSIADYADSSKSDTYQKFASYNSAMYTKRLYKNILPSLKML